MGDDIYIDNIDRVVNQEWGEIDDAEKWIKHYQKCIFQSKKKIKSLNNIKIAIKVHRQDLDIISLCDHNEDDEFNRMILRIGSGLGYAGNYCPKCGTLYNNKEYPEFEKHPTHPFKENCEHVWITYNGILKDYSSPILSIFGRWCSVCGRLDDIGRE